MKKILCLLVFFLVSFAVSPVFAVPPPPPRPGQENKVPATMILSSNGQVMMKMVPAHFKRNPQGGLIQDRAAYGEAFSIAPDGRLTFLWRVPMDFMYYRYFDGDYYLADDGRFLVRIKPARGMDDREAMVVFYNGKPGARYSMRTFMPKLTNIPRTGRGTTSWITNNVTMSGNYIGFQTIDNQSWSFDVRTPPKLTGK